MTDMTTTATTENHAHHAIPDSTRLEAKILLTVLAALIGWGLSVFTWGIPGLYIPALAMVPVLYVLLILISRG